MPASPLGELTDWQRTAADADLLARAADAAPGDANAIARLRRLFPSEHVRIALLIAEARRKLARKFPPELAERFVADPEGAEMASSHAAATHKAGRFRRLAPAAPVLDLCCGVGADALALAAAGRNLTAVDLDPVRAWMAGTNAGCPAVSAEATDAARASSPGAAHIDPARRSDGRRRTRLADLRPDPAALRTILDRFEACCVKLGPGVEIEDLRADLLPPGRPHELEVLSESGRLTQALLWTGPLASPDPDPHLHPHRATLLPSGETIAGPARLEGETTGGSLGAFLLAVDPAVERARQLWTLAEAVGAVPVHPRLGLLAADAEIHTPFAATFAVLEDLPWNERRVKAALSALGGGVVEVKTRDGLVDPDTLQTRLRGAGDRRLTLFVLRFDRSPRAIVCERLARRAPAAPAPTTPAARQTGGRGHLRAD